MQELKEQKIWLLWQWEDRDGKRTKVPKSVKNGKASGTSAKWAHTWGSYDEAVVAGKKYRADGIGFSVPKGYFFLDIDHKEMDDPFVQKMLTRFDSYAERSVSGEGIHIYGKCDFDRMPKTEKDGKLKSDKAFYQKNPHNGTELYIGGLTNHFAVVTEDVLLDKPLRDCTEAVLTTLDKDMRKAEKKKYSPKRDGVRSNEGSRILCELSVTALGSFAASAKAEDLFDPATCESLVRHLINYLFGTWKGAVLNQLEANPYTEDERTFMDLEREKGSDTIYAYDNGIQLEHIFGTTLIAGVLTEDYLLLLHQGDGRCTVMYQNGEYDEPVPWDDRCFSNLTTSVCDEDAIQSCRYKVFNLHDTPIAACIISSDGVEDSLAVNDELVHSYFDGILLYGAQHAAEKLEVYLEESLPDMTKNGSGDDITICGFFDPNIVLAYSDLFQKRKQIIELQSILSDVIFKIDSIERSVKMKMLQQKVETASAEVNQLKEIQETNHMERDEFIQEYLDLHPELSDKASLSFDDSECIEYLFDAEDTDQSFITRFKSVISQCEEIDKKVEDPLQISRNADYLSSS